MASFNEVDSSAYTNNSTVVGGVVRNLVRSGTTVTFEYQAYIRQSTSTWSTNAYALWVEGSKNIVKPEAQQSTAGTNYYTNWVSKTVTLGTSVSSCTVSVGVNGNVYYPDSPAGYVTLTLSGIPTVAKPTLSSITAELLVDSTLSARFNVTDTGNETPTNQIQLSTNSDFASAHIVQTLDGNSVIFSNLDPGRTYYVRGKSTNSAGTTYTNKESVTLAFNAPGGIYSVWAFGNGNSDVTPSSTVTIQWGLPYNEGSTPVDGYRVRIFKNYVEVDSAVINGRYAQFYTTNVLSTYGFTPGDVFQASVAACNTDYAGTKHYGQRSHSNLLDVKSDKFIYLSENGGAFDKHKIYISENGNDFVEIKKEKFNIIQ